MREEYEKSEIEKLKQKIEFQKKAWAEDHQELVRLQENNEELIEQVALLRVERDQARARFDSAVKLLTSIHSCIYPNAVKMEDGRLMVFRPENPHEYLQALSDRIRALPDDI